MVMWEKVRSEVHNNLGIPFLNAANFPLLVMAPDGLRAEQYKRLFQRWPGDCPLVLHLT